ncbi:zinc-dependent peptidase [Shewanella psychrotolerans]|uniref:M90 family metallopeptidase n=1 Tax=Shewanella psychrotolerans TaxID=2864206 RepID=UPI001C65D39F|nr:M90 family metallopeptidase [Shewanella psychrotolerans]QYK02466.1 zinc-dependent peptidase [Shewanella psychrotolerans]
MLAIFIILILSATAISYIWFKPAYIKRKRQLITKMPFPSEWRAILKRRMPYFRFLPTDLQLQLKQHIKVFIAEKQFIGCQGIIIDDEMRVTIAAQACLLLLNRETDYYPKLKQILVYPSLFIANHQQHDTNGVIWEKQNILSGESWEFGKVILSWHTAVEDAAQPFDGHNVVIHEFAHQLDQEDGYSNGAPILASSQDYAQWSSIMAKEYASLQYKANHQEFSIFNYYGATNPAEFFAVVTETFFEKPIEFSQLHPILYQQMSHFFKLDPVNWH